MIKRLLTVALATVFIAGASAQAQNTGISKKNKKTLETENIVLKEKLDSLVKELERCRT